MKRSKIFLGVTTGILAVAGVAAAKRISPIHRLYCTQITTTHYCEATNSTFQYTSTDPNLAALVTTVVTKSGPLTATVPVYTSGTVNSPCSPTNCIKQLVKSGS